MCAHRAAANRLLPRAGELMMKTIFVPIQNIPAMKSTLETLVLLAERAGSYIEGVPLWFGAPDFAVPELASISIGTFRAPRTRNGGGARAVRDLHT